MKRAITKSILSIAIQFIRQHPKALLALPIAATIWYSYEVLVARPAMSHMGIPELVQPHAQNGISHILRNDGFMLEYSEGLENPLWVTYKVKKTQFKSGKRPSNFSADWRSYQAVKHQDYTGSGYDRGHMAPNYLIASRYGRNAQKDTFLMTNISPQKGQLNQKSWQRLEETIANDFSDSFGEFWVITGPIFSDKPKSLKRSSVKIPKAFYKILIKPATADKHAQSLAFIFPQKAKKNASLMQFVSTIDAIENATGLDFLTKMDEQLEQQLESSKTPELWRLKEVATRPNRY